MDTKNKFQPNDRIFAMVPGLPAWPAKVLEKVRSPEKAEIYKIVYYGICHDGIVKDDQMVLYTKDSKAKHGKSTHFNKFKKAMEEIEKDGIPLEEAIHSVEATAAAKRELSPDITHMSPPLRRKQPLLKKLPQ